MQVRLYAFIFLAVFAAFINPAQAKIRKSAYIKEVSKLEWQILNWTAAWRGSTKPAGPFILDRMEYKEKKIYIYLGGDIKQGTDDNLHKSIDSLGALFKEEFPEIEPESDFVVYYHLESKDEKGEQKTLEIDYKEGTFSKSGIVTTKDLKSPAPSY